MPTLDLKRRFRNLYQPSPRAAAIVDVPPMAFLMIDGHGDPNTSPDYADAIGALYAVAYTAKFTLKRGAAAVEYPVMPLEGLWWTEDMTQPFSMETKDDLYWTAMIMQPEVVTPAVAEAARQEASRKKPNPALAKLRLAPYHEGLAAQIMHIGPYAAEGPTIATLHAFIAEQGYRRAGKHHEIYVSDPRRTLPERLRTVIRQPIQPG